ncbi:MAG: hypothetical protein ACM3VT_01855 [Solirubrobacterales bacterium]
METTRTSNAAGGRGRTSIVLAVLACLVLSTAASAGTATLVSAADSAKVCGPLTAYASVDDGAWGTGVNAVATWQHGQWSLITGSSATWISNTYSIEGVISGDTWRLFKIPVTIPSGAYNISGSARINADNAEEVYVNGTLMGSDGEVQGACTDNEEWSTVKSYTLTGLHAGDNTVGVIVRNYARPDSSPTLNPTGLIYEIVVEYDGPLTVGIDIKPGSYPNAININGNGVIPVAILGSATLDVSQIDPATLLFGGLNVKTKNNGALQCSIADVSGDFTTPQGAPDGYPDLVCQFADVDGSVFQGQDTATLTGNLYAQFGGTPIQGSDTIKLVSK